MTQKYIIRVGKVRIMGSRLENVRKNVEQAERLEWRGLERAEQDAAEIREIKSVIGGMERDVDEDILQSIEATREAAKNEASDHMRGEVHNTLEEGYRAADEAINEGTQQKQKGRRAASDFSSISSRSEYGRSTAESASQKAENLSRQFEQQERQARNDMEAAEKEFNRRMAEIMS